MPEIFSKLYIGETIPGQRINGAWNVDFTSIYNVKACFQKQKKLV